ncbi:MAG: phosphoglucosamine mutase [Phycisphaeraceae bacterium]
MKRAPLMLGVSGLRGIVGQSLTEEVAWRYGRAIGRTLLEWGASRRLLIGRDSRPSGPQLATGLARGLADEGIEVLDLEIASTPAVGLAAKRQNSYAIVLTASHNPTPWNGVKLIRSDGSAPTAGQASQVVEAFKALSDEKPSGDSGHSVLKQAGIDAASDHASAVAGLLNEQMIQSRRFTVVVDSVCGAGGPEVRQLLGRLGVKLIHLHSEPTGRFPHEPEPLEQNLTELADAVRETGADAGFAQDPDADRLAIVDNAGRYIGEECTLALCARHRLREGDLAVANLSTSRMIDDLAARVGARVLRSAVGEANVAEVMRENNATIGGEGNGGVIDPRLSHIRDSLGSMGLILELMATTGKTLAELRDALPLYTMQKEKVPRPDEPFEAMVEKLLETFAGSRVDQTDGVRFDLDGGWIHVRPSNTEPILRFIAEAPSREAASALTARARQALRC